MVAKAPLAHSVPQEASQQGFAAEFERLASRLPTEAESEVAARLARGCSVWAESFLPESLAHLALALTCAEGKRVLCVSLSDDLLEHRQLRLGQRGPCVLLRCVAGQRGGMGDQRDGGLCAWATPGDLDAAHLSRAFGAAGPEIVIVEDAQAALSQSFAFRPSLARLKALTAKWPKALVVASAPARGASLRTAIGKELGLKGFTTKKSAQLAVIEGTIAGPEGPVLRIENDESDAIAAVVGPLPRPAVVLCSTPAQADQVYAHLEAEQVPVHRYHAGLPASERARELVHFALPGRRAVMVAVSSFGPASGFAGEVSAPVPEAFGHGYARRDLRSLVHLCAPCSLDQYAQELSLLSVGGTSGKRPVALMLYNPAHLALNLALLRRKRPTADVLSVVVDGLLNGSRDSWLEEEALDRTGGTSPKARALVLDFLEDLQVVERKGTRVKVTVDVPTLKASAKQLAEAFETLSEGDGTRLEEVEAYALSTDCRAKALSQILGQTAVEDSCGSCDICDPSGLAAVAADGKSASAHSPTIETLPTKRRTPVRRSGDDDDDEESEDFLQDLDALEA